MSPIRGGVVDVVQFFLDGLKQRSKYAVCTADYEAPGRQTTADCSTVTRGVVAAAGQAAALQRGDLVRLGLDSTGDTLTRTGWCSGQWTLDTCRVLYHTHSSLHRDQREEQTRGRLPAGLIVHYSDVVQAISGHTGGT